MSMEAYQAASLALLVVSVGIIGVRFWKMRRIKRNTAGIVSDALYVAGFLVYLAMGALFVFLLFKEIRIRKERDIAPGSNPMDGKMYLAIQFFSEFGYRLELWLLKFAYIASFWGIFKRLRNQHIWTVHLVFVAIVCTLGAVIITLFINCQPISRHWATGAKACPYTESITTLKLATYSNIATYVALLVPPTTLLITSDFKPSQFERSLILILYILFLIPLTCSLIRYVHLYDLTSVLPISSNRFRLTTLLTLVETTALFIPLALISFFKSVNITPESPYSATLILPEVAQPTRAFSGRDSKRRSIRLPLGFPSLPTKNIEFRQKSYGFDEPDVVELGDAMPGVDYKVYSPDALTANYDYVPPQIATPTPPPSSFSPPPASSIYSTPYTSPKIGSGYTRTPSPPALPPSILNRNESGEYKSSVPASSRAGAASATSQRSGRSHRSRFEKIRERIEQESQRSSPVSKRCSPTSLDTSGTSLENSVRSHVRAESASTVRSPPMSPLSFNSPVTSPTTAKRGTFGFGSPPMSPVTREERLQFYQSGG